jgi:hypothetical protein
MLAERDDWKDAMPGGRSGAAEEGERKGKAWKGRGREGAKSQKRANPENRRVACA